MPFLFFFVSEFYCTRWYTPKFNIAPEKWWFKEDPLLLGQEAHFQGLFWIWGLWILIVFYSAIEPKTKTPSDAQLRNDAYPWCFQQRCSIGGFSSFPWMNQQKTAKRLLLKMHVDRLRSLCSAIEMCFLKSMFNYIICVYIHISLTNYSLTMVIWRLQLNHWLVI